MCSEPLPKEFEKTAEVLPISRYGLTTADEFKKEEEELKHLEQLKKAGLTSDDIKLFHENESDSLKNRQIESGVLKNKLEEIYRKIDQFKNDKPSCEELNNGPSTSKSEDLIEKLTNAKSLEPFYPEGHPMHSIKGIEQDLFGHLNTNILPTTKRRKLLRRLERRKEKILLDQKTKFVPQRSEIVPPNNSRSEANPRSLWDVKELPKPKASKIIGPKIPTMYTLKDNKIVRLEPVQDDQEEYRAVDIVLPINQAEEDLLEGTKMSVDDIRKIERFKDYEPGIPSKVLYLKNISPGVSQEQVALLFNQFVLENGGPIDVRLMTGRMRGQAFVGFEDENVAIQALEEINGTILSGKPIIAQFGRNSNRIQDDNR